MHSPVFWIIVVIVVADFIFERVLDYLNYKHLKPELPQALRGIYDEEKYARALRYEGATTRLGIASSTFSLALVLAMLFGGGFALVDQWVSSLTENPYLRTLLFFGVLGLGADLLSLPFQLYSVFVVEERFGFNKTTIRTFVTDKLKGWLLGMLIGGGLVLFVQWAWLSTGRWFRPIVFGGMAAFMVFMTMFYSRLIVPLFNKQTPLEDGELKQAIEDFARKTGFELDNIFVIDGSKRSTKANAYFSGLGPKKRVVLYDTLINDLETEQIVAVLAHEIGHYRKKHIYKGLLLSFVQTGLMLALLAMALDQPGLSQALGAEEHSFYMGLLAFGLLFTPVSFFTGILANVLSRRYEYQADAFAKKHGLGKALIDGLIRLSVKNLSNLTPHPAYVFFHYSHPTLLQRKARLESQ